jgi:hypothetical protein
MKFFMTRTAFYLIVVSMKDPDHIAQLEFWLTCIQVISSPSSLPPPSLPPSLPLFLSPSPPPLTLSQSELVNPKVLVALTHVDEYAKATKRDYNEQISEIQNHFANS